MTKRWERTPPEKVKLLPSDPPILKAVLEARYLTADLVAKLCFKPTLVKWCYSRLRALYDMKFLNKRVTYPSLPDVYLIGMRGKHFFERLGYEREWLDKVAGVTGSDPIDSALWMPHDLTLSKLYVNACLEAQTHGWEVEWKNARVLELEHPEFQPDGWVKVGHNGKAVNAFVEFTDEIPARDVLERKIAKYEGRKVLWVTTSARKLKRLAAFMPHVGLTTIDECGEWLTAPIWNVGGVTKPWITATTASRVNLD